MQPDAVSADPASSLCDFPALTPLAIHGLAFCSSLRAHVPRIAVITSRTGTRLRDLPCRVSPAGRTFLMPELGKRVAIGELSANCPPSTRAWALGCRSLDNRPLLSFRHLYVDADLTSGDARSVRRRRIVGTGRPAVIAKNGTDFDPTPRALMRRQIRKPPRCKSYRPAAPREGDGVRSHTA
jgi:hypothetical protein